MTNKLFLALIGLVLMGCAPKTYQRSYTYVPEVEKQGDIDALGTIGSNHVEGMVSVSPFNHLNVNAQVYAGSRGRVLDYGIGTYWSNCFMKLRLNLGLGAGILDGNSPRKTSSTNTLQDTKTYYTQNSVFDKQFIQPSISLRLSERAFIGFGTRINRITYSRWEFTRITELNGHEYPGSSIPLEDKSGTVIDYFAQFTKTWDDFYANVQLGKSEDTFYAEHPFYSEFFLNVGFGLRLSTLRNRAHESLK